MVLQKSMGRLLHAISRDLRAHEQSKPGSAVEVPTASSRDGLTEEYEQAAAYHWPGLSVSIRAKQAWFSGSGSRCVFP